MNLHASRSCILRHAVMLLMLLFTVAASAVPAKPGLKKMITLTDGTTVSAQLVGDEYGHYWLGADGKAYQAIGGDVYQSIDVQNVKKRAAVRRNAANQHRTRRLAQRKVGDVGSITGQKKCVIILVNFTDVTFTATQNDFNKLANQVNYNSGNYKGSMYDYFYAQSDGQFQLTFDVVGPYTLSHNCAYYGGNDSNGDDSNPGAMVKEAVQLANSDVNYADYDWDNDGYVDQVYVVYAGKGEADGGAANTIWPHAWDLSSATGSYITLDGKKINSYACGGEQNGETGATAGIGTMCHEFSHCLGYPDFYDTDYSGGQGMGYWDLMDSGSYNGDGYRPAGYTSYERWVAGWKTPTELTTTQTVSNMKALQDTGSDTYIIYNKANNNEYYLLENRQKTGWDTSLPGKGLLILHVDYNASAWSNNTPNDTPSHQRMTWIPADNQYQYETYNGTKYYTTAGMANDPFPYGNKNSFGRNTTPAAMLYNNNSDGTKYLDSSVENITQNSDGTITFNFVGVSNVATPTFSPAAGRYETAQTVSISCATTGATIYYTIDGTVPTTSSSVYSSALTISETTTVKAIAVKNGEESAVATATYKIGASSSDPNTTTFSLVTSTDDLEDGLRYVIACGSKAMAAGAMGSGTYLSNVSVNVSSDVITITDNVAVFVLEQGTNGWTFKNEDTNEYLICTAAKNVSYSSSAAEWTLSNGNDGVIMTMGDNGTMLYNVNSPRFTTYTSTPTASMIQANLYVEDSSATPVTHDPLIVADETVTFSTTVGTPQTKTFEVMSEGLTEDITVTLTDANNVFSLGSSTISRTASELGATCSVTFTPTAAGTYNGTITLTSAGADPVTVSLSATATEAGDPTPSGETVFYEGLSSYSSDNDGTQAISTTYQYLDYSSWSDLTKVYAGGTSNAYDNGGCLKLGSSNAIGSMTTGSLSLTGTGTLTFYLKKYGSDTGKLNVTVDGATADVTQFTPSNTWTLCTVNLTNAGGNVTITLATSAKRAYVDEITLTSGSGTTPVQKDDVTMSFSPSSVELTQGETFTKPTLTTDPAGLTVTYSSSNTNVATVDASTGEVTLVAAGTTTITATFAGDDDYNAGSASYTLTVNPDPNGPGSESDPYTVAEARDAIDAGTGTTGVYATGIVSKIVTAYNSQYGNITYDISSDGTTTSDQLRVYRGKSYNGDNFTSADDIQVGDEVVVYGNLILYGNSTYEFAEGNQLVSLDRPQKDDVTMSFSPTTAEATIGEDFTEPTLTTNPSGLAVTYSSSDTSVATVDASTGEVTLVAAGTVTITATFAGNATYNEGSASYELTVSASTTPVDPTGTGTYALVTDVSTLAAGDNIIIVNVDADQALSTNQQNNNRAATDDFTVDDNGIITPGDAVQIITLEKTGENFLFNVGDGYLYAASSSKNWLKTEATADANAKAAITIDNDGVATIAFQGSYTRNIMRYNPNNDNPIFSCYGSTSTAGTLTKIYREVPIVTLTDTSRIAPTAASNVTVILKRKIVAATAVESGHAWNTICFPFSLTENQIEKAFGENTVVKELTEVRTSGESASLSFTKVTAIEANKPYIMQVEEGGEEYTFEGIDIEPSENPSVTVDGLQFIGNYVAQTTIPSTGFYILNDVFKKSKGTTKIRGFRAYFNAPTSMNIMALGFDEGDATGIELVESGELSDECEIYDLTGRKLSSRFTLHTSLPKGMYIVNGKKVFIK